MDRIQELEKEIELLKQIIELKEKVKQLEAEKQQPIYIPYYPYTQPYPYNPYPLSPWGTWVQIETTTGTQGYIQ